MTQTSIPQSNPSSSHHPDMPRRSEAGVPPEAGRDPKGRFAKGNPGGPGNPFARQVAAMRQEFFAAATKEDIAAIARVMIEKAKEGDTAAARIVLQYTLGKPAETVDPDRLDEMEWQQWQREKVHGGTEVLTGMGAGAACAMARVMVPAVQERKYAEFEEQIEAAKERRGQEAARRERQAARQAERKARRAERQSEPVESARAMPRAEAVPVPDSSARAESPKGGEPAPIVSPVEAQKVEEGGRRGTSEAREAAVATAMRLLGATVNKPGETARRAANDVGDRE